METSRIICQSSNREYLLATLEWTSFERCLRCQGMVFAIIGVYMTPPWVLLKLVQLGGFIVFFFVIPFVVREPYYTPKA